MAIKKKQPKLRSLSPNREKVAELRAAGKSTGEIRKLLGITKQGVYALEKPLSGSGPGRPAINMRGEVHGFITVGTRIDVAKASVWNCECKCGRKFRCTRQALIDDDVQTCEDALGGECTAKVKA